MTKGLQGKYCESCSRKAKHVYLSPITGERTHACEYHYKEAMEIAELMRLAAEFDGFGGLTFDPDQDGDRLGKQLCGVLSLMVDGKYRTLRQISDATKYPEASISARLRDIRKIYGKPAMEAKRIDGGLWTYRCLVRAAA